MLDRIVPRAETRIITIDPWNHQAKPQVSGTLQFAKPDILHFLDYTRQTAGIVEGCISLFQPLGDGRRQILDILGPGRLIGPYLADLSRCGAIALTRTQLEVIDPDIDNGRIDAAARLMLLRSRSHALLLGRKTMVERVATALLDLAWQFARGSSARNRPAFFLHLTRAEMADWLGLTLESVSRCLNAFKRDGLITFDHPQLVTIRDRRALQSLAAGTFMPARQRLRSESSSVKSA
jgi:CRP/FNR family transcriptional regulator